MLYFIFLINILLNIIFIFKVIKKERVFSPYIFFYILVLVELMGPLIYYIIFKGKSYRIFDPDSLLKFNFLTMIWSFANILAIDRKKYIVLNKKIRFTGISEKYFQYYSILIISIVVMYLFIFRNNLLLVNLMKGNNDSLVRSDTSGALPRWYTLSSFIFFIIPSFYFAYSNNIKNKLLKYSLFFLVSLFTMIDGNKGLFIYLLLFMFIYEFRYKFNKYVIFGILTAFIMYFIIKDANINLFTKTILSAVRRFFVSQGAGFINRIHMVDGGYIFSPSIRISNEVFSFVYGYENGAAPTIFWGDLYVKYGFYFTFFIIFLTPFIFNRISDFLLKYFKNDIFMYWSFAAISYIVGMAELSYSHNLRIMLIIFNAILYAITLGRKKKLRQVR